MDAEATAREAFELLPAQFTLARGSVRIHAQFWNGQICEPVKITAYRVPPAAIHTVVKGPIAVELLERIAAELEMNTGATELVAEYEQHEGRPRLRWVDFTWRLPVDGD